jgi:O-antigen/teichoic acid export membrane protein
MRADDLGRRVATTAAWAAFEAAATFIAGFVLAALFISELGATRYGIYLLILLVCTPGLLTLADLGMGGVVVTFVARYRAEGSSELPRLITFATRYYLGLTLLLAAITAAVLLIFSSPITFALAREGVAADVLVFVVLLQAVSVSTLLLEYLLAGLFDYRPIQASSIVNQGVRLVGSALLINAHADLAAIIAWVSMCSALRALFLGGWLLTRYPALLRRASVRWSDALGWLAYSRSLLARTAAGLVFNFSDRLLIGMFLPASRLAQYEIAAKPANMVRAVISIATSAVVTASATAKGLGRRDTLQDLYIRGGRIATVLVIPPMAFLVVHMADFIRLWVGPEFLGLVTIGQVFLLSYSLTMVPAIGDGVLVGMGEAQRTVKITWVAVAVNLAVSAALVVPLGIIGVAIGTVAGSVVSDLFLSRAHTKALDIRLPDLLRGVILPSCAVAALSLAAILPIAMLVPTPTWLAFLISGATSAAAAYGLAIIAIPREDRQLVASVVLGFGRRWAPRFVTPSDQRAASISARPQDDEQ